MYTKLKNNKGFTIIEVLIVLAIAALILLIVFLAVPALQRSAHNTTRKNDVSGLLSAMSDFAGNNSGTVPNEGCWNASSSTLYLSNSGNGSDWTAASAKLGYYTSNSAAAGAPAAATGICTGAGLPTTIATGITKGVAMINGGTGAITYTGGPTKDFVALVYGATCNGTTNAGTATPTATTAAGTADQYVALYEIEAGSGTYTAVCTQS